MDPVEGTHRDDVQGGDLVAGIQQHDAEGLPVQVRHHELLGCLGGLERSGTACS